MDGLAHSMGWVNEKPRGVEKVEGMGWERWCQDGLIKNKGVEILEEGLAGIWEEWLAGRDEDRLVGKIRDR